ncbi:SPFH domain-containing protein [Roseospira visakhapatnamensis]|uniref:Protein QmcA n=1 Tax=Roseospira visakhapatnamensis TaxID=390880 RepID=A0A7W6RCD0_9PROT|nr:SPFH domain-containing protein [Roseospira visakhapatnamensis]MBB4265800.1 regulator of protease activity HflC (stomatin/prohibitin superfamily) [Roseospira visakhapatnamensis]
MMETTVLVITLVVLAILFIALSVKIIPQGWEYTVERFGQYTKTLDPGLHLIVPFVEQVGARMNMMEQVLDVPEQEVITRDNAMVTVDGVVFYQVLDAPKAAYEVRQLEVAILNLTMTNVRTVMGSMDLDELLSQRDKINAQLLTVVDLATNPWGVKVTRIEIKDISPPRDLVDSMARQMKAERDKRASILVAEGEKQATILQAEGLKQGAILEAEGRREAAWRDAEARERLAEAEARATAMVSEAIGKGSMGAVNYFVALKYVEALQALAAAPNQKVLMLPMEATGILGSVAGIAEIAKEALGPDPSGGGGGGGGGGEDPARRPTDRGPDTASPVASFTTSMIPRAGDSAASLM